MLASNRVVYEREFGVTPVWLWLVQRMSGLLLAPLTLLHMSVPKMPGAKIVSGLLLVVVLAHGYSGLVRISPQARFVVLWTALAAVWCAVIVIASWFILFT